MLRSLHKTFSCSFQILLGPKSTEKGEKEKEGGEREKGGQRREEERRRVRERYQKRE